LLLVVAFESIRLAAIYFVPRFVKKQLQHVDKMMVDLQARSEREMRHDDAIEGEIVVDAKQLPPAS
jgi:hypothetical protein